MIRNLFAKLFPAQVQKKSFESVTAVLAQQVDDLRQLANEHEAHRVEAGERRCAASIECEEHYMNSKRCNAVADKFAKLLGA